MKGGVLLLIILLVIFSSQTICQASENRSEFQVEYIKDNLTINVKNITFGSLLNAIREKTGIQFALNPEYAQIPVSFQFGPLPLSEGLKRILSRFNHALLIGQDNKISRVILLGYASPDSLTTTFQATKTQDITINPTPSSTGKTEIRPFQGKEGVTGSLMGGGMTVTPSSPTPMVVEPSIPKDLSVRPSSEMPSVGTITGGGMVVTPSPGTMVITPGRVTEMVITHNQGGMVVTPSPPPGK